MKIGRSLLAAAIAASFPLLTARTAGAQDSHIPSTNWRQSDRVGAGVQYGSPQYFTFEVRFGAYKPEIDKQFASSSAPPYQATFGDSLRFYFGLELDVLPLRIPYVGAIGPGIGWGFTRSSAPAPFSDVKAPKSCAVDNNPEYCSAETTSLTIMPMHASAVLRIDELMRRTNIPVVPYGKIGFALAYWRASNDLGTEQYTKKNGEVVDGIGLSLGMHFAVGGMLSLNFIDPRSAARLDEATGVNHIYLFGEWMRTKFDIGSRTQMNVGTSTWVVGLAVDL
jgi:hypothetical protein